VSRFHQGFCARCCSLPLRFCVSVSIKAGGRSFSRLVSPKPVGRPILPRPPIHVRAGGVGGGRRSQPAPRAPVPPGQATYPTSAPPRRTVTIPGFARRSQAPTLAGGAALSSCVESAKRSKNEEGSVGVTAAFFPSMSITLTGLEAAGERFRPEGPSGKGSCSGCRKCFRLRKEQISSIHSVTSSKPADPPTEAGLCKRSRTAIRAGMSPERTGPIRAPALSLSAASRNTATKAEYASQNLSRAALRSPRPAPRCVPDTAPASDPSSREAAAAPAPPPRRT